MSSRVQLQKQQYSNFTHHATSYCNTAIADIMYIREQARLDSTHIRQLYHIVRYEDLAADPMKGMENLYNFMGMSPDEKVRKWAKNQAIPAKKHENRAEKEHGTWRRNPKATSTKWRKSIKYSSVLQIQKVCKDYFNMFGYHAVKSEKELRNHSIPVVSPINTEYDDVIKWEYFPRY